MTDQLQPVAPDSRITMGELASMFPQGVPTALMKLLFPESSEPLTPDELRLIARSVSAAPTLERETRHGLNLITQARMQGWKDDGEGPLEFLIRSAYELGHSDARREAQGER